MTSPQPMKFHSLQILRAVAAIVVVWHHILRAYSIHATAPMATLPPTPLAVAWLREGLAAGVDIFFVISGFIMVYVAGPYVRGTKPPHDFLIRRIERVYPPYWIATLIVIAGPLLKGATGDLTLDRVVRSFLLVPGFNAEGLVQPLLGVGWTLSYEMYFYLSFCAALTLLRTRYWLPLTAGIVGIWAAAIVIGNGSAIGRFLADPIVFEFLFGCAIGWYLQRRGRPRMPFVAVAVAVAVMFGASHLHETGAIAPIWRCLYWGLPAAVIVAYTVSLPFEPTGPVGRFAVLLGDASFSIYLVHVTIVYVVMGRVYPPLIERGLLTRIEPAILLSTLAAIAAGVAFHFAIERPINQWRHRQRSGAGRRAG
ncbi:acyltransferase family protein [Sphingomonas hankookensis]|uniref:acyltransferase family protein n=1 Tax=Sphingomonas hankookensis TaxID=563996 RepID=UPI001F5AB279|nr:acyltransferase [Sphingomonas hankookensis]